MRHMSDIGCGVRLWDTHTRRVCCFLLNFSNMSSETGLKLFKISNCFFWNCFLNLIDFHEKSFSIIFPFEFLKSRPFIFPLCSSQKQKHTPYTQFNNRTAFTTFFYYYLPFSVSIIYFQSGNPLQAPRHSTSLCLRTPETCPSLSVSSLFCLYLYILFLSALPNKTLLAPSTFLH